MFRIIPYESVGLIRFGASAEDVKRALGEPVRVRDRPNEMTIQYDRLQVTISTQNEAVVEIGMSSRVDARLDDVEIFNSPGAFEKLTEQDGSPFEYLGFIILLKLGITLTGFHDDDPAQRAVTAFARGRWDHLRAKFNPFHLTR